MDTDEGAYIMIIAAVGEGQNGNIAIDDITLTFGECSDVTTVSYDDNDDVTTVSDDNDDVTTVSDDDDDAINVAADADDVVAENVNNAADAAVGDSGNLIDDTDANIDDTDTNVDADGNDDNEPADGRM